MEDPVEGQMGHIKNAEDNPVSRDASQPEQEHQSLIHAASPSSEPQVAVLFTTIYLSQTKVPAYNIMHKQD